MKYNIYIGVTLKNIVLLLQFTWQHNIVTVKMINNITGCHLVHAMIV